MAAVQVFVSYSHTDERLRQALGDHLATLQREGLIDAWNDRKITAGQEWAGAISENLERADIILLLVSASFLASAYCNDIELRRALERHERGEARVIPVLLKPCDWTASPFAKLQALPGGKAITSYSNRDQAFTDVAVGIRQVVQELTQRRSSSASCLGSGNDEPPIPAARFAASPETPPAPKPENEPEPPQHQTILDGGPGKQAKADDWALINLHGTSCISHSREERLCVEALSKAGMLVRIKSPDKMGKSSLMGRVIEQMRDKGYRSAVIDLSEANQEIFSGINPFLQWFCAYAADQLNVSADPIDGWKKFLGANPNATKYVERELLKPYEAPLVLAIDNFDRIFSHPGIETDFSGLLRGWFERVNTAPVWGQLRQLIVYSQDSYGSLDINQSPLNVGIAVELGELTAEQVGALAHAALGQWSNGATEKLMALIGGHPYLVQIMLEQIRRQGVSLEMLLEGAATEEGIFGKFLMERLQMLESIPALAEAMRKVVGSEAPVRLPGAESFKLTSMGLVKACDNDCLPRCQLYRRYFQDRLCQR